MTIPTRASLLVRLRDLDDQESWQDFFDTYSKLVYNVARKAGLSEAEAQDVLQETVIGVAKRMPEFRYSPELGSFKGWLLQITRHKIADHFRTRLPTRRSGTSHKTTFLQQIPDPAGFVLDSLWEEEWQKTLMKAALKRVKKQVKPEHYNAFVLYVIKETPVDKVAEATGIHVDQVYLIKHRISSQLKQEVKRLESKLI